MKVTDFDYELPEELIAQHPVEPRDTARLLTLDKVTGEVSHKEHFYDLLEELHEGDVLVFNNTKVIPARLYGHRQGSGGKVEVLLLTPCVIEFDDRLRGIVIDKTEFGGRIIEFTCNGVFDDIIQEIGEMPLPPYIHEKLEDKDRYQNGVELEFVTLHVGLGTFRPVSAETIEDHEMHSEFFVVSQEIADRINAAKRNGRRIIAVGTTSVRTLESATNDDGILQGISGWTQIFIYPGYKFKMIDALVTNFHLPQSTLLMLISALAGREHCLAAYEEAVRERYRFFSFGDAMFIR
ncbi:unnamed protein product [Cylicocyclus nassatus]|uniref:S-adenosylmethionine:tRNA ribosyltransferase-isomerase n=1 Tax=Cylicocyclus nassatus TaxID=53992 RepID=A0AA36DT61_CYLNA|nr:unnamed protein product [Cylicocyclus nassatus]